VAAVINVVEACMNNDESVDGGIGGERLSINNNISFGLFKTTQRDLEQKNSIITSLYRMMCTGAARLIYYSTTH